MSNLSLEYLALWTALVGYSLVCAIAVFGFVFRKWPERTLLALLAAGVVLHTVAIGMRWARLGHLPVAGIFEMLSANVWGLGLAITLAYWLLPRLRPLVVVVMPVIIMVMAWMLLKPSDDTSVPPTYDTIWLYVHIGFYKIFLGCAFIALGMATVVLLRGAGIGRDRFAVLPDDQRLDETAYRFMAAALIFDTLGLFAGAIWAQDAWGRYWSWGQLEVWSLVTWLAIGLTLHVRATFKTGPLINAAMIVGTWCIAFFTFFGIPFVTTALHSGRI